MKKMFKRTTAIAASALMIGQMVPYNVFATPATTGTTNLTIHPYVLSEENYNAAKASDYTPTGKANVDGNWVADAYGEETAGITFDIVEVDFYGKEVQGGHTYSNVTNVVDIPNAFYKITPYNNDTDVNFKDAEAFYLHLPAVVGGKTLNTVDIYPKLTDNNDNGDNTDPTSLSDPENPNSNDKHSIKLTKTLSDGATNWTTVGEAVFDIYYKDNLGNWVKKQNFTTKNGVLLVDGLPLGTYYAVETEAPEGYLLDKTPIKFVLDGTSNAIQVNTFPNDKELEVAKEVMTDSNLNTGKNYMWKITADIPDKAQNLISYAVTDTYENQKDVAIASVVATDGTNSKTLALTEDYTVSTGDGILTVTLTKDGIGELGDYTSLEITVTSTIVDGYTAGKVKNSSSIAYEYAYNPPASDPDDEIPDDIPDPDKVDNYPGITSYPDPSAPDYPPEGTYDEFTPATITISNVDKNDTSKELTGTFEVSRCSEYSDDAETKLVTLANLAPGVYTIKQISTQSGYYVEDDEAVNTKTIFIAKNGKVYYGTEANEEKLISDNKIVFVNDQTIKAFDLPFTGTTAAIVFTIAGIGVMGGALFFFIFFKKRDKDEEEQENA
ncbi:SpaA isopeptide-forming pilin-related protein [Ruminococcus albus]|uniref:SpaA isopeptide-forming pilin-related protein n=1 Tax=Ruminococcus albus TaxID=1264 RepID=UPI0004658A6D|nr:SpaA isopeptide-forming pilin-related protein [Ruminococcus albus]